MFMAGSSGTLLGLVPASSLIPIRPLLLSLASSREAVSLSHFYFEAKHKGTQWRPLPAVSEQGSERRRPATVVQCGRSLRSP